MIKYIGQHIVDFIARFRSDVYLEDIADGTVVDNKFLGLDSNNKIVKEAASTTVTDLHTAGVDGSANQILTDDGDGTVTSESFLTFASTISSSKMEFLSPANQADKFQINTTTNGATTLTTTDDDATVAHFEIAADGDITLDAEGNITLETVGGVFTCDAASVNFTGTGANRPSFNLVNNANDATGPIFAFKNLRDGNGLEDDDVLGNIQFVGEDAAGGGASQTYATIVGSVAEADNTDEAGKFTIQVTTSNGATSALRDAFVVTGHAAANTANVTLGGGANPLESTTFASGVLHANGSHQQFTLDGGTDPTMTFLSQEDTGDMFVIATTTHGATTLTTTDDDTTAAHFEIAADGNITLDAAGNIALEAGGGTVTIDSAVEISNDGGGQAPHLKLLNANADADGPFIQFFKSADGADGDSLGKIVFKGDDEGGGDASYGQIQCLIADATPGEEAGKLQLKAAQFNHTLAVGLELDGDTNVSGEVDVNIAAGAGSTTTIAGDLTVTSKASIPKRKFSIPADGAGNVDGDIVYVGTGSSVAGKIYYYASNGTWQLTNSDDPSTATGWLAVALGTDPDVDGMLVRGTVDLATDIVGTEALGSIIYLDKATTGTATTAAPTATGDIVRVIGYALTTGNENKIWFSPDNTWVEHV